MTLTGEELRFARGRCGMTRQDLARHLGTHWTVTAITALENSPRPRLESTVAKLWEETLDLSPGSIWRDNDSDDRPSRDRRIPQALEQFALENELGFSDVVDVMGFVAIEWPEAEPVDWGEAWDLWVEYRTDCTEARMEITSTF